MRNKFYLRIVALISIFMLLIIKAYSQASITVCFAGYCDKNDPIQSPWKGIMKCGTNPQVSLPVVNYTNLKSGGICSIMVQSTTKSAQIAKIGFILSSDLQTIRTAPATYSRQDFFQGGYSYVINIESNWQSGVTIYDGDGESMPTPGSYTESKLILIYPNIVLESKESSFGIRK